MNDVIEAMFDAYDRGEVSRAEVVIAVKGQQPVSHTPDADRHAGVLTGVNLHHINLNVADLDRTEAFYRRLFSLPPKRAVPGRPDILDLGDGVSFLSVPEREPYGVIDHFCVGVRDFEPQRVGEMLAREGFTDGLTVGEDFVYVTDPDGFRVQISAPTWRG
jgi:catechol 2,3-dioxygenase-like lactoylglutathione lyase family enzyme